MTQHRFLENHPQLRDRLCAFAVFTGIAIGGVSGVEMVIGGGFDALTPGFAFEADTPRHWYDAPVPPGAGWLSEPYVRTAAVVTLGARFNGEYPLDASVNDEVGELDGGAREASEPASQATDSAALSDAFADEPTTDVNGDDAAADDMQVIEDRMAQALPEEYQPELTTDVAKEISGNAAPL